MSYEVLYIINFEHSYFAKGKCRAIEIGLTAGGAELFRRRGLQLRRTDASTWEVLFDRDSAGVDIGRDILELSLNIVDSDFSLYTLWEEYNPNAVYSVELPQGKERVKAPNIMKYQGLRGAIGTPFCTISIRTTKKIISAAHKGEPCRTTIYFESQKKVWEYIFIPHDMSRLPAPVSRLSLDTVGDDGISFTLLEEVEEYGRRAFRTHSQQPIQMSESYNCSLNLIVVHPEQNRSRQMLLRNIEPPELNKFQSSKTHSMRRVCYL